ncbi:intermembrane phospholipid transport protein YdbH family protein [Asticcacaulis solisilvae]|uniref:intermembrane phospholipid transport protein YdbH family protein n=1 Tax=Asticcacaulis solisilvae TaxID=1217274 RepID=UPI003FD81582
MIENRPTQNVMGDDEALWFPAQMGGSDSFLRVTRPDGAPEDGDDGIGLPNPRPPRKKGGKTPPRKGGIRASSWLWIALWGTAAVSIVAVAARKEIAAEFTREWLKGQGVTARVKFDTLSFSHVSGHVLIGDEAHPDVSVEHFDADYSLNLFAGHGQPLIRLNRLHAIHPLVALVLKDGRLHFGSLDKLVQNALNAPATGAPPPGLIQLDDVSLLVTTDYGVVKTRGNLTVADGRIRYLSLSLPASQFNGPRGAGEIRDGSVVAKAVAGDQLEVHAAFDITDADVRGGDGVVEDSDHPDLHVQGVGLTLDARLPYRSGAVGLATLTGPLAGTLSAHVMGLQSPMAVANGFDASLTFNGNLSGTKQGLAYDGSSGLIARADALSSGNLEGQSVKFDAPALSLRAGYTDKGLSVAMTGAMTGDLAALRQGDIAVKNGHLDLGTFAFAMEADTAHSEFKGSLKAARATAGDISASAAAVAFTGNAHGENGDWTSTVTSDISGTASYAGLSSLAADHRKDPKAPKDDAVVAMDRAFQGFAIRVRGLKTVLMTGASATPHYDVRLNGSAEAQLNGGGRMIIAPIAGKPLISTNARGGFALALDGSNLPRLKLDVSDFGYDPRNTSLLYGRYAVSTRFSTAPVSGVALDAHGQFSASPETGLAVTLDAPATVTVASAELGDHIESLTGTVSQTGGALFTANPAGWHASGLYSGLSLTAPAEQIKLSGGQGRFEVFSQADSDALGMKLALDTATITDAMADDQRRFNAMKLGGTLAQDRKALTGRLTASVPVSGKAQPVATIALDNDVKSGRGSLSFDTHDYLTFAKDGLQPDDLSPIAGSILAKDVSGHAAFTGSFDWAGEQTGSHGLLTATDINYTGATGVSQGLNGRVVFTSLAPLQSEPGQVISIKQMQLGVPLHDLNLRIQFQADRIAVEAASVESPGGPLTLEPTVLPLDGTSPIAGAVSFNGLDFGAIVATTGLSQSMTFNGKLTGRVPFTILGGHITFADGSAAADAPGRISILRSAVTGVSATGSLAASNNQAAGSAPAPDFNPFQDLAFQAMEHLSYDKLDAKINSAAGGKLDLNFHIKGRFDPPQTQKATVSLSDYVGGKWMQKPIKLPSGTPIELYLDVPINLDEILNDLGQFGKAK